MTGASMAAPHVTGTVALALSRRHKSPGQPPINAVQVRRELIATTQNFTGVHNKGGGLGVLDVLAFVSRF
jgi:subtilisin family serine protease